MKKFKPDCKTSSTLILQVNSSQGSCRFIASLTSAASASAAVVLELLADEVEGLEDAVGRPGHGDDPLGDGAVGDVDLGAGLLADPVDDLAALPDDGAHLLPAHDHPHRQGHRRLLGGREAIQWYIVF